LVDKILTTRASIEGEQKRVTVLFADGPASVTQKLIHYIQNIGLEADESLAACQDLLAVPVGSESWSNLLPKERKEKAFKMLRNFHSLQAVKILLCWLSMIFTGSTKPLKRSYII
jgi:hypothetical protein